MYVGLGQTASPEPCGFLDTLMGTCVQNPETDVQTQGSYQCNWLQNLFSPSACASAATSTPAPPTLPAQPTTILTDSPLGAGYTSVLSGTDSNGNPIYVNTPTGVTQQIANVASIAAQATANAPVDCTQWYNQLFSAACPCTVCGSLTTWAGIGIAATILILVLKK